MRLDVNLAAVKMRLIVVSLTLLPVFLLTMLLTTDKVVANPVAE